MIVNTTRFGDIEVDEKKSIHFQEGILGFPEDKEYIIIEHKPGTDSPFIWLQSLTSPDLAFVLTNPFFVNPDYLKDLSPEEENLLKDGTNENIIVFAIVTIPSGKADKSTVNLMGPIVIDPDNREGRQVILANSDYSHCYPLNRA